jgi:hypothetical protein
MDLTRIGVSRRESLEAGACALAGALAFSVKASAGAGAGSRLGNRRNHPEVVQDVGSGEEGLGPI